MSKSKWGPIVWNMIHCLTLKIKPQFFDEEKKLFIFKDEDDVKRRNSTALATSSLVNEELLDTDDESVQTFRFVPNI